jgi:hypothetical protein
MSPIDHDPTVDENGQPYQHDTFPPGTMEAFVKVRSHLIDRLRPFKRDIDLPEGEQFLTDLSARVVAIVRLELWKAQHPGGSGRGD